MVTRADGEGWTMVRTRQAGPPPNLRKRRPLRRPRQCKEGASAEELRECERAKQSSPRPAEKADR